MRKGLLGIPHSFCLSGLLCQLKTTLLVMARASPTLACSSLTTFLTASDVGSCTFEGYALGSSAFSSSMFPDAFQTSLKCLIFSSSRLDVCYSSSSSLFLLMSATFTLGCFRLCQAWYSTMCIPLYGISMQNCSSSASAWSLQVLVRLSHAKVHALLTNSAQFLMFISPFHLRQRPAPQP